MTMPLAPFLTRFSAPLSPVILASPVPEAHVVLSTTDLAARIALATGEVRDEAEHRHAAAAIERDTAHAAELAEAVAASRAEWAGAQGEVLAARLETGLADLRAYLVERVAAALRPMMAEALRGRLEADAREAIDRLLADPGAPMLSVRAPADLLDALRAARPMPGIEWIADESVDVAIAAGASRVEGRLAAALEALGKEA